MLTAMNVADFFIDTAANNEFSDFMTNLRLQKLLFLAQGWALVRRKEALFPDNIEAWQYGPVVPTVYHQVKTNWKYPIMAPSPGYDIGMLSIDDVDLLTDILSNYNDCSTSGLVTATHDMPIWRKHLPGHEVIPVGEIQEYFETINPRMPTLDDMITRIPIDEGTITADGKHLYKDWEY